MERSSIYRNSYFRIIYTFRYKKIKFIIRGKGELKEDILALNIDELTPVEALIKLNEIKRILNS